jgi:release factor glutamine methyltransferase
VYRRLLPAAAALLRPGGVLAVEVGAGQAAEVVSLLAPSPLTHLRTLRDLSGIERVVVASAPE